MNKKIPYGKQTITNEDIDAVVDTLKSDYLTQGSKVPEFEKLVATYHGAKYGVGFSSGTAALHAAYHVIGIDGESEIITAPITFAATANAAVYCGGTPVFTDIDSVTNCIDIGAIRDKITDKTKAVVPVALAGYPVDLKGIKDITDEHDIHVIYDAAHAIASRRDGTFGMEHIDMAVLSFHPVKHIATGEGGMVLTNDEGLYDKLRLFRSHGITKDNKLMNRNDGPWYYEMVTLGYNYRMTDIQAALGISQFGRIADNLKSRNILAGLYGKELGEVDFLEIPPSVGFDVIDNENAEHIHSYHLYTLKLKNNISRLDFYNYLHSNGILAQIHYIPLYRQPYYNRKFGYSGEDYPVAEDYYKREISIPMYHNMNSEDTYYVIDKIKSYVAGWKYEK